MTKKENDMETGMIKRVEGLGASQVGWETIVLSIMANIGD